MGPFHKALRLGMVSGANNVRDVEQLHQGLNNTGDKTPHTVRTKTHRVSGKIADNGMKQVVGGSLLRSILNRKCPIPTTPSTATSEHVTVTSRALR